MSEAPPQAPAAIEGAAPGETYRYCAGTVTEFEIHDCIYELTPEQQRRRGYSQRLVYKDGRQIRFENVNGLGVLVEGDGRVVSERYEYEGKRVVRMIREDRSGVVHGKTEYSSTLTFEFWLDAFDRPWPEAGSKASGLRRFLDDRGRVLTYTYVDARGRATPSPDGLLEVRVKRNALGAIVQEEYFDLSGRPAGDDSGVQRVVYAMHEHGWPLVEAYFDVEGGPATRDGAHKVEWEYDDVGNVMGWAYYGADGARVRSKSEGVASGKVVRDAHGIEIDLLYFDEFGGPALCSYGYSRRKKKLDKSGDPIEWRFYGVDGAPMRVKGSDHHRLQAKRDERGLVTLESYYDVNDRPIVLAGGYQSVRTTYDPRGNPTVIEYLDDSGALVGEVASYAEVVQKYDGDRRVSTEYLDGSGEPIEIEWGYAGTSTSYDEWGRELLPDYFDAAGRPVVPMDTCEGTLDEEQRKALQPTLEPLLTCAPQASQKGFSLALRFEPQGKVSQSAFIGLGGGPGTVRRCMEEKLAGVTVAPADGVPCRATTTWIRLQEPRGVYLPR